MAVNPIVNQFKFGFIDVITHHAFNHVSSMFRSFIESKSTTIELHPWHPFLPDLLSFLSTIDSFPKHGRHDIVPASSFIGGPAQGPDSKEKDFYLIPKPTSVKFKYLGETWSVSFTPLSPDKVDSEKLVVRLHSNKKHLVEKLLSEAQAHALSNRDGTVQIHTHTGDTWVRAKQTAKRSADSIILPAGVVENSVWFAREFYMSEYRFAELGMPWRAGMLFHGSPGSGKTSLALVIASECSVPIYVLNVNDLSMSDANVLSLIASVPSKSLLVLDDLRPDNDGKLGGDKLTVGGLLASLDSFLSSEGRIVIATTNAKLCEFDTALVRPGRLGDITVMFDKPSKNQLSRSWSQHYPLLQEYAETFALKYKDALSMAEVQSLLRSSAVNPLEIL